MKLKYVLKTGQKFTIEVSDDHRFSPDSLTAKTVHKLVASGGKQCVFVQGDNIAYVLNEDPNQ